MRDGNSQPTGPGNGCRFQFGGDRAIGGVRDHTIEVGILPFLLGYPKRLVPSGELGPPAIPAKAYILITCAPGQCRQQRCVLSRNHQGQPGGRLDP